MAEHSAVNRRVVSSSLTCGANQIHSLQAPIRCLFPFAHNPAASSFRHPRSIDYRTAGQPRIQSRKGSSGGSVCFIDCGTFHTLDVFNVQLFRIVQSVQGVQAVQCVQSRSGVFKMYCFRTAASRCPPCPQGFVKSCKPLMLKGMFVLGQGTGSESY